MIFLASFEFLDEIALINLFMFFIASALAPDFGTIGCLHSFSKSLIEANIFLKLNYLCTFFDKFYADRPSYPTISPLRYNCFFTF